MTKSLHPGTGSAGRVDYKSIVEPYAGDMARVEDAIRAHFHSNVALIPNISGYLMGSGGKRIRPLLLIISSRLCGYAGDMQIDLSVVVEYVHAATLLHDDVVDGSNLRRGAESANARYGNQASVLVGDFLFAKSLELMAGGGDMRIVETVARATRNLAEGEVLQLVNTCNAGTTEEIYLDTVYRKTGALIQACLEIGAILGKADEERIAALGVFGRNIGMAFQLMDDALDYTAVEEQWGKPVGADFQEGKVTLPLIRAYIVANAEERAFIERSMESEDTTAEDLALAISIMEKYGAMEGSIATARKYCDDAKASLAGFSPSPHLDALRSLADYIIERQV
ncbi:MAG: polyprenyl synthetase family protein [Nitrospinota bacterium]|nr:polyprenyl synthetase family protein [Nitrospinota bacterium]MDH5679043.1 polyprenyl synthetase family protein [Nitrospinota bacterium]